MNRNALKIIAVVAMLIDHVGLFLLNNNVICRSIGRVAFPIFTYFIAEGMRYTRSRKKYILHLLICAVVTQVPFALLFRWSYLNVIFTFLVGITFIVLFESFDHKPETTKVILKNMFIISSFICLIFLSIFGEIFELYEYGLYGVFLVVGFYFSKTKPKQLIAGFFIILLFGIIDIVKSPTPITFLFKMFALFTIPLLVFYNKQKGKINLKYLFYIAYPANFLIIYLIQLF